MQYDNFTFTFKITSWNNEIQLKYRNKEEFSSKSYACDVNNVSVQNVQIKQIKIN